MIQRATKTTRFFTTLSLNAPWNCVMMSAQKPRAEPCGVLHAAWSGFSFTRLSYQLAR